MTIAGFGKETRVSIVPSHGIHAAVIGRLQAVAGASLSREFDRCKAPEMREMNGDQPTAILAANELVDSGGRDARGVRRCVSRTRSSTRERK